ncbi:hypothetical protein GJ744_003038 [Endocarpon pusillum]|uniref:Uncharacterized protein n=1 Tax=Endocarpon pusillum TaxID=364733 RepID=A0A8H7A7C3_9EURO|nr:hypothetical protein GJ744_003038 [Endocarpon pusillum]
MRNLLSDIGYQGFCAKFTHQTSRRMATTKKSFLSLPCDISCQVYEPLFRGVTRRVRGPDLPSSKTWTANPPTSLITLHIPPTSYRGHPILYAIAAINHNACRSLLLLKGLIGHDFYNTIKTLVINDIALRSYKALAIRLSQPKVYAISSSTMVPTALKALPKISIIHLLTLSKK